MQGLSTVSGLLFFFLAFITREKLSQLMGLSTGIVLLMFFSYIFQPAFEYWSARNRYEYKYKGLVVATIIYTVLNILIPVVAVLKSENYLGEKRIYSTLGVLIGFTLAFYIYNFVKGKKFYVKEYWKYALWFNIPLLPHYLSNIVLGQSDRIMIGRYCGESQAGIYSIACYLQTGVGVIVNAINSTFVPWLYERLEKKEYHLIQKRAEMLIFLLGYVSLGLISCAPEIIRIMAPSEYYEAMWAVPPVIIGSFISMLYMFFGNVEVYYEKRIFMTCSTMLAAVLNVVLNYALIPVFGYIVCAYTTMFCYLVYAIAHYVFMCFISTEDGTIRKLHIYDVKRMEVIYGIVIFLAVIQTALYRTIVARYAVLVMITITIFVIWKKKGERI
jgi:O-antigen/teichoic acid export membrane protein